MSDQQTIDNQRDKIDDKNSEIQRLHDRMELIDQADLRNCEKQEKMMGKIEDIGLIQKLMNEKIDPMIETFNTIRILGRWTTAIIIFLGVLGGAIYSWIEIFSKKH
jgi:hypothetical protein